uniref:Uncharacterized protein n=1 Tax=Lepeophtheirus salmonis TaxID=72036 RepID=A0A0K2TYY5_LEPSM
MKERIAVPKPIGDSIGLFKTDNGYLQSPAQSLRILMETHFPVSRINTTCDRPLQETIFDTDFVEVHRVKESFNSFRPFKSSVPDGLKPIVLKNRGQLNLLHL